MVALAIAILSSVVAWQFSKGKSKKESILFGALPL